MEIQTRCVIAAIDGPPTRTNVTPGRPRASRVRLILRDPVVGDEVTWEGHGELIWTVEKIQDGIAQLTSTFATRPVRLSAPLAELRVRPSRDRQADPELSPSLAPNLRSVPARGVTQVDAHPHAPARPRRELDEILDGVTFSTSCNRFYGRLSNLRLPLDELLSQLREEIRYRGFVLQDDRWDLADHSIVIRVPGRFDIVLPARPGPDDAVKVEGLRLPRRPRRHARGGKHAA